MVAICMSFGDIVGNLGLSHWIYVLILVAYSCFGGWLFMTLERPRDEQEKGKTYNFKMGRYSENVKYRPYLEEILKAKQVRNINESHHKAIEWYLDETDPEKSPYFKIPEEKEKQTDWTFLGSVFFSTTIYSTIGYGNFTPQTLGGRWFTIFYALIGIPIFISILSDWGTLLFVLVKKSWNLVVKTIRKVNQGVLKGKIKGLAILEMEKIRDEEGNVDASQVPLSFAIGLLLFWICGCAGIYLLWEDWDYFTSFYYFFIAFATIGLGDVVPSSVSHALLTFVLVMMGLAIVGLAINVIQAKIECAFEGIQSRIEDIYKSNMDEEEEENRMGGAEGDGEGTGKKGVVEMEKNASVGQKMLIGMMGNEKKKQLEKKWEEKAKKIAKFCQTDFEVFDVACQMGKSHVRSIGRSETDDDDKSPRRRSKSYSYGNKIKQRSVSVSSGRTVQVEKNNKNPERQKSAIWNQSIATSIQLTDYDEAERRLTQTTIVDETEDQKEKSLTFETPKKVKRKKKKLLPPLRLSTPYSVLEEEKEVKDKSSPKTINSPTRKSKKKFITY